MSSIPGLEHLAEDGFEIVKYDVANPGESYVGHNKGVLKWRGLGPSAAKHIIIRKIPKPKRYRAFANAAEYMPHWGKPVKYPDSLGFDSIISTSELGVYTAQGRMVQFLTMEQAFGSLTFADGSPFGVEVQS